MENIELSLSVTTDVAFDETKHYVIPGAYRAGFSDGKSFEFDFNDTSYDADGIRMSFGFGALYVEDDEEKKDFLHHLAKDTVTALEVFFYCGEDGVEEPIKITSVDEFDLVLDGRSIPIAKEVIASAKIVCGRD